MKSWIKPIIICLVLLALCGGAAVPLADYLRKRGQPEWRLETVEKGQIVSVVNSTGTIQPILSVSVGSFVSGPIEDVFAEFNQRVKAGDKLASIDTRLFDANVARDRAQLATRRAEVDRVSALLLQAQRDESRAIALRERNIDFISDTEMDQFHYSRLSLEAQLVVAEKSVEQAEASLKNSEANLDYTEIESPVDGIVIDRKVDKGQTVASTFQTPELFIVALDLDKRVHVFATVDEADIGLIREAKENDRPVTFIVDAYPDELFEGRIQEIRFSSTTTQNVVTYPVIVEAPNTELKLLPGMTATISFEIEQINDAIKIPNSALRFYPERKYVHPDDHDILDGAEEDEDDDQATTSESMMSTTDRAEARRERDRRHVWIVGEDGKLRAVEVIIGASDYQFTELVEGDIKPGQELVSGIKPKKSGFGG